MMNTKTLTTVVALAALLVTAAVSVAAVPLHFSPADTTIQAAVPGRLSVLIDSSVTIRTIDVTVSYDTTIVRSLGGGAGALYTSSGYQLFRGFEEPEPGVWHGYSIVMGSGLSISGPGELYYWDFEGIVNGTSPITSISVYLSDVDGLWYDEVDLPPTTIIIGDPVSAVPPALGAEGLRLAPNPFNPRTTVGGDLVTAAPVRLTVHDLRGRLVAVLHDGSLEAGSFALDWDGHDLAGRTAPGGLYLFRLESGTTVQQTKGLLLK